MIRVKLNKCLKNKKGLIEGVAIKIIIVVLTGSLILGGTVGISKAVTYTSGEKIMRLLDGSYATDDSNNDVSDGSYTNTSIKNYTKENFVEEYYFDSIDNAVSAINNNSLNKNNVSKENAKVVVGVRQSDNVPVVKPLKEVYASKAMNFTGPVIIDLNGKTINVSGVSGEKIIAIKNKADVVFRDSAGGGRIYGDMQSESSTSLVYIEKNAKVTIVGGEYSIGSRLGEIVAFDNSGVLNIMSGKISADSYTTSKSCNIRLQDNSTLIIKDGEFTVTGSNSVNIHMNGLYTGTVNIESGNFQAYSRNKSAVNISTDSQYAGKITINSGTFNVYCATGGQNICFKGTQNASITINDGDFMAIDVGSGTVTGALCSVYKIGSGVLTINGGHFAGAQDGLLLGDWGINCINGGTFEGYMNGGASIGCKNIILKNATFKKWTTYKDNNGGITTTNNTSVILGSPNQKVEVFADNCVFENKVTLTAMNNCKQSTLYISNSTVNSNIAVGTNNIAYVGKNVIYKGHSGAGTFDSTTYKDTVFSR